MIMILVLDDGACEGIQVSGSSLGISVSSFVGIMLGLVKDVENDDGVPAGNFVTGLNIGDLLVGGYVGIKLHQKAEYD